MKKILLSIAVVISGLTQAQTLTQAGNEPLPWNPAYAIYQCDSMGISPGNSGASQMWDFSMSMPHLSLGKTYSASQNSNSLYSPAYTRIAASVSDDSYYNTANGVVNYYGGHLVINGQAVSLVYISPAIVAKYPMGLGTSTVSTVSGSVTISGVISGTFTGNSNLSADATGSLMLAGKTFTDVLRIVTSQTLNATLSLGTATVTQQNYNYYAASAPKVPLYSISTSTIQSSLAATSAQTITSIYKDYLTAGVKENQKQTIELSVFPNPSTTLVNFNTSSVDAVKVSVYDLTGKLIDSEFFENGKSKVNVAQIPNGIYLYTVAGKNNNVLTSGKITVNK